MPDQNWRGVTQRDQQRRLSTFISRNVTEQT